VSAALGEDSLATPEQRRLAARIGGISLHLYGDSDEIAARARHGLDEKFRREIDPEGVLTPAQLDKKLKLARRLHFTRLAKKSADARRKPPSDSRKNPP
jgi:hypothetical protein